MSDHVHEPASQPVVGEGQPQSNGAASTPALPAPAAESKAATSRAENLVDNLAVQVAVATSYVGKGFLRLTALFREQMSDLWAEAQSIRRGDKP
jgi:hypothetical protein